MFECAVCGKDTPGKAMELNASYEPVCPACYQRDVPDVDVMGAVYAASEDMLSDAAGETV